MNPGYDPATDEVPVQFALNFVAGNATTRQGGGAVQEPASTGSGLTATEFRGIEGAHILCFKQSDNGKVILDSSTAGTFARDYDMDKIVSSGSLSSSKSSRVLEMSLPLKTNTIVFYGRAKVETDKNAYGHLGNTDGTDGYNVSIPTDESIDGYKTLKNVSFHLAKRLDADKKAKFQETQKLLAGVLTCIMNTNFASANVSATDVPEIGIAPYTIAFNRTASLAWSDYFRSDKKSPYATGNDLTPLEEKLYKAYKEMTTIKEAELRNASGTALISTMTSLWSIINSVRCATPTTEPEAVAKYMANEISKEIKKYFHYSSLPDNGGSPTGIAFESPKDQSGTDGIIKLLAQDTYWPTTGTKPTTSDFTHITDLSSDDLAKFPGDYDLPQGATHIKFNNSTKLFEYEQNYNTSAVGGATFTVDDYYYPAELLYFGNSPIRVSNEEHPATTYPVTTDDWHSSSSWSTVGWPGTGWNDNFEVQSSTRSVAMINDINYGTALLQMTVEYADGDLKDNNANVQLDDYGVVESDMTVDKNFKLKGVVIGGQAPRVGWDFLPALASGEYQGFIYDKAIALPNDGLIPTSGKSDPNYTLVFDNYTSSTNQDKVFIALELQNNTGKDFFGKANLIPSGSNFYLIGELDPSTVSDLTDWPTHHALPPYESDGTTKKVERVFIQDHKTIVNFKIGQNSLKSAYLTVPDLRSSSVTLGLSVDMKWSTGLDFGDVVLGGTEGN